MDPNPQAGGSAAVGTDPGSAKPGAEAGKAGAEGITPAASDPKPDEKAPTVDDLTKTVTDRDTRIAELEGKLGKQGDRLGHLNAMAKQLEEDPKGSVAAYAKRAGIKISFADDGAKPPELTTDDGAIDKDQLNDLIDKRARGIVNDETGRDRKLMLEHMHRTKHENWDELQDDRRDTALKVAAGLMSQPELLHFAAIGQKVDGAVGEAHKAGFEEGRQAAFDEIAKKTAGDHAGAGGGPDKPPTDAKENQHRFKGAITAMETQGRR